VAEGCFVVARNSKTGKWSAGYTVTGPDLGTDNNGLTQVIGCCAVSAAGTVQVSDADEISQLGGPFVSAGGGFGKGAGGASISPAGSCPRTNVSEGGIGGGFQIGLVGITNTYVTQTVWRQ